MSKTPRKDCPRELQCPCCDYFTLRVWGANEICPVCFWENDEIDYDRILEPSTSNDNKTLDSSRTNFEQLGACGVEWLQKVCSPAERAAFKYKSRQREVQLFRLVGKIAETEIQIIREDTECPQCEWGDVGEHSFRAGAKGVVVYGIPYADTLKLWCASPGESQESLVVAIMKIAEQIGFSLEVAVTEKHQGWEGTRFAVELPGRRKSRKR